MFLALATTGHTAMMSMGRSTKMICWIRRTVEQCDSLQSFFLIHSLGGGTGSGLGTYALELLEDNYPEVFRFVTAVFPSADDDVITSPYNSCLAISKLRAHASCVFPVANDALMNACRQKCNTQVARKKNAFDDMNEIVANLLINLTSSMRFEGSLNVDLNEITTNLVPPPPVSSSTSTISSPAAGALPAASLHLICDEPSETHRRHRFMLPEVSPGVQRSPLTQLSAVPSES
eukprot:GHVS01038004.1.p1 GENE.GHVS01038004.1~~GHVS01038004.1.p1  ORF type:complete len:233 (-),score=28.97 GHVS01038004.1:316-1014(-)